MREFVQGEIATTIEVYTAFSEDEADIEAMTKIGAICVDSLEAAKNLGLVTVGLTGKTDIEMADLCEYLIQVPSTQTQNIQEVHIMVGHNICGLAECTFLSKQEDSCSSKLIAARP